jgi:hypothetical protein
MSLLLVIDIRRTARCCPVCGTGSTPERILFDDRFAYAAYWCWRCTDSWTVEWPRPADAPLLAS